MFTNNWNPEYYVKPGGRTRTSCTWCFSVWFGGRKGVQRHVSHRNPGPGLHRGRAVTAAALGTLAVVAAVPPPAPGCFDRRTGLPGRRGAVGEPFPARVLLAPRASTTLPTLAPIALVAVMAQAGGPCAKGRIREPTWIAGIGLGIACADEVHGRHHESCRSWPATAAQFMARRRA